MTRQFVFSRRSFVKAAALTGVSVCMGATLGACAAGDASKGETDNAQRENQADANNANNEASQGAANEPQADTSSAADQAANKASETEGQAANAGAAGSTLVAYFSATGHTQAIAEAIAADLGADIFVITPTQPYASADLNYNNQSSRVYAEHDDPNRHVELTQVTPDNFASYETIFVGYPTWWGGASWVMNDFVTGNDFAGKTVVPFTTSASSPLGTSASDLAALCATGNWLEGKRFSIGASEAEVSAWLQELGY